MGVKIVDGVLEDIQLGMEVKKGEKLFKSKFWLINDFVLLKDQFAQI